MAEGKSNPKQPKKISIGDRPSKVFVDSFASLPTNFGWYEGLSNMIPDILAGKDLKQIADEIVKARRADRHVVLMMGAHVVKCGLGGLIAHLVNERVVTAIAMNGACAIHDVEIALWGRTSEDVESSLKSGEFGMTAETSAFFAEAARSAHRERVGFGRAVIKMLAERKPPNGKVSIIASAGNNDIPLTIHVAIGTDVIHQHDLVDGAALGFATMRDFWIFADIVGNLKGGVLLNIGSAVIMPEVFLKALAIARARGIDLAPFTTANFDMYRLYRPLKNIVERPRLLGATTYNFIAHHEIILPILFAAILAKASH